MRAFALDDFGQRGSIHDLPDPEPAENEVRVRVTAASINPFDNAVLQGYLKGRMEHRFPLVPCGDLAGTVDALGSGVEGVAIGDSVFGVTGKMVLGEGTLAELATASTSTIAKRPAAVSEIEAVRKGGTVTSMKGAAAVEELAKRDIKGVNVATQVTSERLDHLARLAAEGKLKAPHIQTFSLERASEAFQLIVQDTHLGKVVVRI